MGHAPLERTGTLYDQGERVRVLGLDTWVVRAGPRGETPIVLLHGTPTSAFVWREVIEALHERHDCVAFDWPGFGSSAKPKDGEYTHRARADHLGALLDALGLRRVHLVVHDLGGPAGMLFALENPERVDSLVVLNTTVYKRDYRPPLAAVAQLVPVVRELARPFFNRATFEHVFRKGLARPQRMRKQTMESHWRLAKAAGGRRSVLDSWAQLPEGAASIEAIRARMKAYEGRVLVLFGADDPFLPPPNAERLAKDFGNAELQLLAGAGHFVMEDAPEVVAERIEAFLA